MTDAALPQEASTSKPSPSGIDVRGPRFGAALSAVLLLAVVILGHSTAGLILLAILVLSFALGAARGAQGTWQGLIFKNVVQPKLKAPTEFEDPAPPRFAQLVGFIVTSIGLVLGLLGVTWAVPVFAAIALVAAFLNAAFAFCLGCEVYLLGKRLLARA